ncbi:MAG: hypothetical protein US30_C0014G0015 [Candidatus Moranbacteria bacterium GW2011_GWF2_36_839]|nr:MAG: hypothetical protein US27_C0014G0009 [Candidatus Moranbacteria bacterium GW2011_GWF1_36_78]KKQ16576.1 MAG: hypothetical protein US30_C0014G0015 [Candidatus Moranbacteria bacterium GW2011_GWF2_36_839]HAT73986.1 hypothetical protein [Candidatus Moranbacteria bacterium]HBY10876.1 hypothetical protein [Candidatus Moranbacteria bacterium]
MKKRIMLVVLAIIFVINLLSSSAFCQEINYGKKNFVFGQTVFFNFGDDIYGAKPNFVDRNGFFYPHNIHLLHKGMFLSLTRHEETGIDGEDGDGVPVKFHYYTIIIAVKYPDGTVDIIDRQVNAIIPQQNIVLFNW